MGIYGLFLFMGSGRIYIINRRNYVIEGLGQVRITGMTSNLPDMPIPGLPQSATLDGRIVQRVNIWALSPNVRKGSFGQAWKPPPLKL